MGGGWKNSGKKYLFLKDKKHRYLIWSNNLELVTIIECISATGNVVPPSFCLQEALCLIYTNWMMPSGEGKHLYYC